MFGNQKWIFKMCLAKSRHCHRTKSNENFQSKNLNGTQLNDWCSISQQNQTLIEIYRKLGFDWFVIVIELNRKPIKRQSHRTPVEYKTSNINIKVYHISAHLLFGNRRSIVRFFSIDRLVQQFKMETLSSTFTFLPTEMWNFPCPLGTSL